MKKDIIRVGDKVKIIKPEFFVRCGYPLCLQDACDIVKETYKEKICDFIQNIGITTTKLFSTIENDNDFLNTFDKIVKALAYDYVRANKFGGAERTIHTITEEVFQNKFMIVKEIQLVKTGIYIGTYSFGYEGEFDPPYLSDQKTHKILTLDTPQYHYQISYNGFKIEDINVEKVKD